MSIIGRRVTIKVIGLTGALLFLTPAAIAWAAHQNQFQALGSQMDIFAHKHHQCISGPQLVCAVLAVLLAKLPLHFRNLWL